MLTLITSLLFCKSPTTPDQETLLLRTWFAICWVESRGDPKAYNREEHAVGIAQIRPIMLADANRIIGYERWDTMDCYNPAQSYKIFRLVVRYYAPRGGPEQWARIWNGGGKGHKRPSTLPYWAKIKARMDAI